MENEKSILDLTKDECLEFIKMQRRIYCLEEYYSMRTNLLDRAKRVLDLRDLMQITISNHRRSRRIINKYAKPCKKEADTKKLLKKQEPSRKNDKGKIYFFCNGFNGDNI